MKCEGCEIRDRNLDAERKRVNHLEALWLRTHMELQKLNAVARRYALARKRQREQKQFYLLAREYFGCINVGFNPERVVKECKPGQDLQTLALVAYRALPDAVQPKTGKRYHLESTLVSETCVPGAVRVEESA